MAGPETYPGSGPLINAANTDPNVRRVLEDSSVSNADCARILGVYESSVRRWRTKNGVANQRAYSPGAREPEPVVTAHGALTEQDRATLHDKLDEVMDALHCDPAQVKGLRVSQWENVMRGDDGEPVVTQLQGIRLEIKSAELAPDWPLIDRPAITYRHVPPGEPRPAHAKDKVALILPDPQIGYRQLDTGLDPFHDESAIDVAMQVAADLRPSRVVCLGDFQDFAEFGKYTQEAAFARTTQAGINRGHEFCAQLRAAVPDAEDISVLEGNHDRRAELRVLENNKAAWGLRRASDTTGWPVFSVPYLCAFDLFDVKYVEGYPAGELWLTDELRCIHGFKVRSSGSTAAAVVKDDGVSTIFGHVHRIELQYLTRRVRGSGHRILAATPGCLCRVDGAVPSMKGSTDLNGRPVDGAENWQQGLAVVEYREGRPAFHLTLVGIDTHNGHETHVQGKTYLPRKRKR